MQVKILNPLIVISLSMFAISVCGCLSSENVTREIYTPQQFEKTPSPFLKVHMMNGELYVLSGWGVDGSSRQITGSGKHYDFNRNLIDTGSVAIPLDSIALFETNVVRPVPEVAPMAIITGVSVAMTIYCLTNPKACFGSCPTFYVWNGERMQVQSEAFSSSVMPALERTDIDHLYSARPPNRNLQIELTNEAMETHVIKCAHLLIARHDPGNRVFVTPDNRFYEIDSISSPISATAPEGSCIDKLRKVDQDERFSTADSTDLASKENIELTFGGVPGGRLGLVLGYRQTLLTTYLFYQGLAYMGSRVGDWIATVQRDTTDYTSMVKKLFWGSVGSIDVMVMDDSGEWQKCGEFSEVGPIATNVEMIPLPAESSTHIRIRLRMTRGLWRLDYAALARIVRSATPDIVEPSAVMRGDTILDEKSRMSLAGAGGPLVTMPGDRYSIVYGLPEDFRNCELFMEARGYYLEWVRKEWVAEENPAMTMTMFSNPAGYLKLLAPKFKQVEPEMEDSFWRSKYVRH